MCYIAFILNEREKVMKILNINELRDVLSKRFGAKAFYSELEIEKALEKIPCIIEAHRIFGEQDYVLLVATPDLTAYQEAYDTQLSSLPNIKKVETTLLMKEIIPHRIIL